MSVALGAIASAMTIIPDLCSRWQEGREAAARLTPVTWSDMTLASAASMALALHQMGVSRGARHPTIKTHPLYALVRDQRALRRYRAWLETRA